MFGPGFGSNKVKNTSYKVVLPFYVYGALSFLASMILLLTSTTAFTSHYFSPHLLAITHIMALGWGTMIILGASHQLVPVLIESKLYSNKLAYTSFVLSAIGIPLLVYGLYIFDMTWPAKWGGRFVVLGMLAYLINIAVSIIKSKNENVHAVFVFTATFWLFLTAFLGLAQVYNFTAFILPADSVHYLALHAHAGIIGWFLLLIIGVASRLIPMFLISKYHNVKILWVIYFLLNTALVGFILLFFYSDYKALNFLPVVAAFIGILLFIRYCYNAYKQRIRKQVDEQVKLSLLSVVMLMLPVLLLVIVLIFLMATSGEKINLILTYGFLIFFGWITAIILGMTFKTLPFIVWNKVYHHRSGLGKTPNPKDLFNNTIFKMMSVVYIAGLIIFVIGILISNILLLKAGAIFLLLTAILYNWNVLNVMTHKPKML
ncbi:MAG: cytochrome C oxidase subunit I [Bacteroidetes bacterium]|nr:cytochrome C oxidase subunit I [Bacteroidota bacterium]MBP7399367.1 cytochrome C oxidase subunit I [Chitinophagales bacterium]MBK7108599.1 cytochrome C oxidase subunit I [Bacteroidota bacterium]MBK8489075.1 cytochrome C oxidase subunit I [Bacteroidota bacterium]MBK8680924.1 cytochrome C oxidase subunit I [Bacteroidota bacterium]